MISSCPVLISNYDNVTINMTNCMTFIMSLTPSPHMQLSQTMVYRIAASYHKIVVIIFSKADNYNNLCVTARACR